MIGALLVGTAGCDVAAPTTEPSAAGSSAPSTSGSTGESVGTADLEQFFGGGLEFRDRGSFGVDEARLISTADAPGGRMLRVSYPAGSASKRADGEDGGMQAYLRLPDGPVDVLDLQYQVRFPPGFDFVKGGKLPGLYGGSVTGGQKIPDGTDGFSTRYMWRKGGDGEVYAYLPTSEETGTSIGRGCWSFPTGRWTAMHQRIRLNTPGRADGEVQVWQDGRQVLARTGLTFRTTDDLQIDGLFFSTFFGGGDTSWASPVDQYADFAAFSLSDADDGAPEPVPEDGAGMATECREAGGP